MWNSLHLLGIYNGSVGFFNYGPLRAEMKRNFKDAVWSKFLRMREGVVDV
jgi:glycyl-tRNA synthetase (class II)